MPIDTKRRKIDIDGKAASRLKAKKALAVGARAARRPPKSKIPLKEALEGCDASTLVQALAASLDRTSPQTLETLEAILRPLVESNKNVKKHCVRCHRSYEESSNTIKSCVVLCTRPDETNIPDDEYEFEHKFSFPCCNRVVSYDEAMGGDWEPNDGDICLREKHTTDVTAVKYYRHQDGKRAKYRLKDLGWNANILTCREIGCRKKRDREDSEDESASSENNLTRSEDESAGSEDELTGSADEGRVDLKQTPTASYSQITLSPSYLFSPQ